jgi:Asp-tRNA(Asn)/Glu-tRNA(Gln) amidotransferase A subunit family amidase
VADASHTQTVLARAWLSLFDEVDVVICPAASVAPFAKTTKYIDMIDQVKLPTYMTWLALSYAPTMVMACSLVVPCGVDQDGMPFGIQLLGVPGADRKLLAIGLAIEQVLASHPETMRPLPDLAKLTASIR